jgi:hypothetical protein
VSKFIQIACSDAPDTESVRQGGPSLWALDDEGRVWSYNFRRDAEGGAWERMPSRGFVERQAQCKQVSAERGRCDREDGHDGGRDEKHHFVGA